jgi:hypothetical protein
MKRTGNGSSRGLIIVLVVIILILAFGFVGVLGYLGVSMGWLNFLGSGQSGQFHTVTYRVKSTNGVALVSYTLADGTSSKTIKVSTPWQASFSMSQIRVYLSTANPERSGDLECDVLVDGNLVKREKVSPPTDKVSCSVYIP